MPSPAAVEAFIGKWSGSQLKERAASQEHFIDLCRLLGVPTPKEGDPTGESYCFDAFAEKADGTNGFADVWKRGFFGWEYKGPRANLAAAYKQLNDYREDLENPPLLVVCDTSRIEVHTNFTGTAKKVYRIELEDLRDPEKVRVLEHLFANPNALRPTETPQSVTEDAAARVASLAARLEERGIPANVAAHFLMQVVFSLFAEDVELLPKKLFSDLLAAARRNPVRFESMVSDLFAAMKDGGPFGTHQIAWFNGGVFSGEPVITLESEEIELLHRVSLLDWSTIEPAIFGTLFERSLDPAKRSQIGAHYTSPEDIHAIIDPVIFAPLRAEWKAVKQRVAKQLERRGQGKTKKTREEARKQIVRELGHFHDRLRKVEVLDPACGSGNFLYLALRGLKDLEGEVIRFAARTIGQQSLAYVSPLQLHGIEIEPFARELAQVVVWIGHLQWMFQNGYDNTDTPILKAFENIRRG